MYSCMGKLMLSLTHGVYVAPCLAYEAHPGRAGQEFAACAGGAAGSCDEGQRLRLSSHGGVQFTLGIGTIVLVPWQLVDRRVKTTACQTSRAMMIPAHLVMATPLRYPELRQRVGPG